MIHLKRATIKNLQGPAVDVSDICTSLQQAVELEHATIPLYLYALYSLDETRNAEIAGIIQSVVVEEMLHMTLAANVLNALGVSPVIDKPDFIPAYPGPLPGGVESGLIAKLAPFSMDQLETFLEVERPEEPIDYKVRPATLAEGPITIGEFYTAISAAIGKLGNDDFVNPPHNQVGPELMPEAVVVTDVSSAQRAINTIVEQGEGTSTSPEEVVGDGIAHYYRFMQIKKGGRLVKQPDATPTDPKWAYDKLDPVPFDDRGVYAVQTNPKSAGYRAGSAQAFANDNFNYTYSSLLRGLHDLFNGKATQEQFNVIFALMMSLKGQAKAMMAGIPDPKLLTGPSFEYLAVNPA